MRIHDVLRTVLRDDVALRSVERDIFSVIPETDQSHHYDKAACYPDGSLAGMLRRAKSRLIRQAGKEGA